jgi:hypothetical protein
LKDNENKRFECSFTIFISIITLSTTLERGLSKGPYNLKNSPIETGLEDCPKNYSSTCEAALL